MDDGKRNSYGGYCPNFRGSIYYTPSLDEVDNPPMLKELSNVNLSATTVSYSKPALPTEVYSRPTLMCASGYNNQRTNHTIDLLQKKETHRQRLAEGDGFYDGCVLGPYQGNSESKDSFNELSLIKKEPCLDLQFTDPPGSRDSGFTHEAGINTLDGRVIDPLFFGTRPDLGRMGHSITHGDYLPWKTLNGREHTQFLSPTASKITSYNRFKELDPCYLGKVHRSACDKLESVYVHDYPWKSSRCNTFGKQVVGKGMCIYGGPPDLNLFQGGSFYVTETKERFVSPLKEGRARDGHLRGAVLQPISSSGYFQGNNDDRRASVDPCGPAEDRGPIEPHRYNPWPRFMSSYKGILDHNYRPHPTSPGADYELQNLQHGTTYDSFPALV